MLTITFSSKYNLTGLQVWLKTQSLFRRLISIIYGQILHSQLSQALATITSFIGWVVDFAHKQFVQLNWETDVYHWLWMFCVEPCDLLPTCPACTLLLSPNVSWYGPQPPCDIQGEASWANGGMFQLLSWACVCHTVTSSLSPTDFPFDFFFFYVNTYCLTGRGNCPHSIIQSCLLNQWTINKMCFWGAMKRVIDCCHKLIRVFASAGDHTAEGRVAFKLLFLEQYWDVDIEATSMTSINSPLCNTISIYQLFFSAPLSNGTLSTPIISPIYLSICLWCFPLSRSTNLLWTQPDTHLSLRCVGVQLKCYHFCTWAGHEARFCWLNIIVIYISAQLTQTIFNLCDCCCGILSEHDR